MKTLPPTFRAPRLVAALCLMSTVALAQSASSSSAQSASTPATPSSRHSTTVGASGTTSGDQLKWGEKRFVKKVAEGGQLEIALAQLAADRATNADVKSFAQQLVNDHQEMSQKLEQLAQSKGLQSEIAEYSVKMSNASDMAANPSMNRSGAANSSYSSTNTGSNSAGTGTTGSNSSINANSSTNSANTGAMANNTNPSRDRAGTVASSTSEYDRSSSTNADRSTTATAATSGTSRMDKDNEDWNDPTKNRHYKHLANKSGADFDKEFISMMVSEHEDDIGMFTKESKKGDDADVRSFAESSLPKLQEHLNRAQQISSTLKS
jgi:putative membrane protein